MFAKKCFEQSRLFYSCLFSAVTWPLNGSKTGGDLVLIKTSLFLLCSYVRKAERSLSKQGHLQARLQS